MNNLAVMYHYVRERNGWGGIVPLHPKDFELQIDLLSRTYDIISVDQIHTATSRPWCVLTFDDGTKDQYTYAFDILKRKGVPAYFTVVSGPIVTNKIPVVHLVHTVLSFKSDEEIWELLRAKYDTNGIEESSSVYHYEKNKLRRFNKYMLNFRLSVAEATDFLESVFLSVFPDSSQFIRDFYLSEQEIQKLRREGMTIGIHGHNHLPYSGNPEQFYKEEIEPCKQWLEQVVGIRPSWYTPAFGGGLHHETMKEQLTEILLNNGFKGAFTTNHGSIPMEGTFWMSRVDCVKIPPIGQRLDF